MCTSVLINTHHTRKSFTILADDEYDSMSDRFNSKNTNLPKIKSVYHQNCIIPNEDFSILYNSIASKLQPPSYSTFSNKPLYSPSKEFFNKVSSKLRDLRPPKVDPQPEESKEVKMERPMFITTVKSGTFLEPPPEVAALLGLRKNSFSNNSSNSSTSKTQNNGNMVYSFSSKPRILKSNLNTNFASRSLFRVETRREKRETLNEPLPKITNDTSDGGAPSYGNTMFDRRVARGSNFAAQRPNVISTEHVLSRQAEARRRAAVRQRAQIRARKLRLGTPPPIDGRRHGQIQTDKFLEELTERPPDKSIACQADLPVQHHSPVYYLDSNTTTGVEAETQIYPGDLPEIDDELPSVVSSIVNKILQEAILEINDEIEVIRLRTLANEKKRAAANSSTNDETGVITKTQLHMLIQQAIDELRQSDQSDSNNKNYDNINGNQLLEKIFDEIKNMVTDVKFLAGIIKTQLENWPEDSNQNNEAESEQAENEQTDEENNASDTETADLRRETLSVAYGPENQPADEGLEQMDAEIDDYKTDDFEEESKDLVDGDNDEDNMRDKRENLNSDTNEVDGESNNRLDENEPSQPAADDNTANDDTTDPDSADVDRSTETTVIDREVPNDSQSQINDRQNSLTREPPPVIITEHNEEASNSTEQESNQTTNDSNKVNDESEETSRSAHGETAEPTNTDDNSQNNAADDSNQNNTNDAANQSSENPASTNPSTITIPTMGMALLDPPINDSNPENDVMMKDTFEKETELDSSDANQSGNAPTLTVPSMNLSLLDPPVRHIRNGDQNENGGSVEETPAENQTINNSNEDQTAGSTEKQNEENFANNSSDNATNKEQTATSNEEQNTLSNQNDETSSPNTDQSSSHTEERPTSNDQNENSTPAKDKASNSNEEQTTPDDQAPAQPSTSENQSSATPTNEDDNDVVAVQTSAEESSAANADVTLQNTEPEATSNDNQTPEPTESESNSTNTESATPLDNTSAQDEPRDSPTGNNNDQTTTDNVSERSSSATTRSELVQDKPSDTESVENNELQSNTSSSEDSNNSTVNPRNQSIDNSSPESDKPLNTENGEDGLNENESNQPEPASEQNPETASTTSSADSRKTFDISSEPTSQNNTLADTANSNVEPSEPLVNGDSTSEPDNELSTQTDIDARNNNESESRDGKSIETNNNDSTIQSKNPTIVQNGNIIANS